MRVRSEEALHAFVDLALQSRLDPLANHGPLLSRNPVEILLDVGVDRLPEGDVEIRTRPFWMMRRERAILEMVDAPLFGQGYSGLVEQAPRPIAAGRDPAIDAERQGNQRVPEQGALYLGKRQDAFDLPAGLGIEELRAVPECLLDDGFPARTVKEGSLAAAGYKTVPS